MAGLHDRPGGGPPCLLSPEPEQTVARWLIEGPDLARDRVTRWCRANRLRAIEAHVGVAERSISDVLRRLGLRRSAPQPQRPGHDGAAHASFRPTSPPLWMGLWRQEAARIGQQGALTGVWATRGSRPPAARPALHLDLHLRRCLSGRGVGAGLVLPFANAAMMNLHLVEISATVTLLLLPYRPELSPVENVWACLRGNTPSNRVFDDYDAIVHACCEA